MGQQGGNSDHDIIHRTVIRYPRTGDRRSGAAEFVKENASACVTACFNELIPNVEDACRQLQQPEHQQTRLWDLYCCDSISCGVYTGGIGQSPNVDLIINECQNLGFFSIEDPGPPATNYCALSTPYTITTSATPHTTANGPPILPTPRTWSTDSIGPNTIPTAGTQDASMSFASTSILASSASSTSSPASINATSSRLTEGAKAAIGIFSVIAVLAIIAVLLLLFRRRRRGPRRSSPGPGLITYVNRPYPIPNSNSGTPLITPPPSISSRNAPLTPPAKLSERRYLEPPLKTGTPRSPASPSFANQTFPPSSIGAPTESGLIPRHDRNDTASKIGSPAIRTTSVPTRPQPSSVYSLSSGPGGSAITVESNKVSSVHSSSATVTGTSTPPLSATRFPRLPEGPPESSDFATPAGPPPTRALPPPPPKHPNSPTFSVSSASPRSPTFPARTLTRGDSLVVPTQQSTSRPPTSISAKELRDLTESYARETKERESWGSWSGVGGGGPGVTSSGRKRGSTEKKGEFKTAVPLQELDLEKLSGRY